MKSLFVTAALALALTQVALADESRNYGTIACIQNRDFSPVHGVQLTVLLKQVKQSRFYEVRAYHKIMNSPQPRKLIYSDTLRVSTEDVIASFQNRQGREFMVIYLDELNQSFVRTPQGTVNVTCKFLTPQW